MLDWTDLCSVLAIGRARNVAEAAASLGVHSSTMFRRLNAVESSLGARLFERMPDGYLLTPVGEVISAAAERIETEIGELNRRVAGYDMRPSGTLRVTTTDTLIGLLTPHFEAFRKACPEIDLHMVVANRFFDLTRHDADVAIRPASSPPDSLIGRRVASIATSIYASADYLARQTGSADAVDLNHLDWIGLDESLMHLTSTRWLRAAVPARCIGYIRLTRWWPPLRPPKPG